MLGIQAGPAFWVGMVAFLGAAVIVPTTNASELNEDSECPLFVADPGLVLPHDCVFREAEQVPWGDISSDYVGVDYVIDAATGIGRTVTTMGSCRDTEDPTGDCATILAADARCPAAGSNIAYGQGTLCDRSFGGKKGIKYAHLYYGSSSSSHPTSGSNHNYLSYKGENEAIYWWKDYKNGKSMGSNCEEKDKGRWWNWIADHMNGGLGEDKRYDRFGYPVCHTGSPRGYWGAGATFK